MKESPFQVAINRKTIGKSGEGYVELFELIGDSPQQKAAYYQKRVNDAIDSMSYKRMEENAYTCPDVNRKYYYRVSASMIHTIDGTMFGELEWAPALKQTIEQAIEHHDGFYGN